MPASRHISARIAFIGLATCLALPALSQNAGTSTKTAPLTAQNAAEATGTPPPASSSPLWANPADLIESETTAASPARSDGTDILSCPFETLRAAYLSLYEETDALNVAALESEVYKVCIERQKLVRQLLDNEERLRTQLGDLGDGTRRSAANAVAATGHAPTNFEAEIAEEEQDVLAAPTTITLAPEPTAPTPSTPNSPETFREVKSAELAQSALPTCSDRYTSGPVFGSVTLDGGLHAFVFDATRGTRLTVKSGDALPGGVTILRISTEEGVVVSEQGTKQNGERQLARTLAAPAFDDGGGLLFKTVTLADVYKLDSAASDTRDSNLEGLE